MKVRISPNMEALGEVICLLTSILFLYTGVSKLLDFYVFAEQLSIYPVFKEVNEMMAVSLPAGEIIVAIALLVKKTRLIALWAAFVMMMIFTAFVIYILHLDSALPCTCGGVIEQLSWKQHLVLNGAFTVLTLAGVVLKVKTNKNVKAYSIVKPIAV